MTYVLPNHDADYLDSATAALEDDGAPMDDGAIGMVGGTLYGHMLKDQYPEATVEVIESNPAAAVIQSYVADQLDRGRSPDAVQDTLFLSPFTDADAPDDWAVRAGGYSIEVPAAHMQELEDDLAGFLERSPHFDQEDATLVYGNHVETMGQQCMFSYDTQSSEGNSVLVDLYDLNHQTDIYPSLLEEVDGVAVPDRIHVGDAAETVPGQRYDVLMTNNVVDWFPDHDSFFRAMNDLGATDGYHASLYSVRQDASTERVDSVEQIKAAAATQPEQVEVDGAGLAGRILSMGAPGAFDGDYHSQELVGGENAFVVRVKEPELPVTSGVSWDRAQR